MGSFDLGSDSLLNGFQEIEEGVYFRHYGLELPYGEAVKESAEIVSFGDFEAKSLLWQKQIDVYANSIALKSVVDSSLYGYTVSQSDIIKECTERGLFLTSCGVSFDDLVEMLKSGAGGEDEDALSVDVLFNCDLQELTEYVDSNDEVICYVNMMLLDYDREYSFPGLNSDSLVHIIGVSFSDTGGDVVIINDTSKDDGAGKTIPLERFLKAWSTSDYTAITVARRRG